MEYLLLELKERLQVQLAEYEEEVTASRFFVDPFTTGKVHAIKEALNIFNEVVDDYENDEDR